MTTKKHLEIHHPGATRTLATEELNARRKRKAFTTPLDPPHQALEPARKGRRTVNYPATKLG
jgi:hypothetical protein